jgi:hypothetical protein
MAREFWAEGPVEKGCSMQIKYSKQVEELKSKLQEVRRASLSAANKGDYRSFARLTVEAAEINKNLVTLAGPIWG